MQEKLMIINRSFWPVYPVIGEALLRLVERQANKQKISVVLQDQVGIRKQLKIHNRGNGVSFYPCKSWSISGSSILRRILDAVFFMVWVCIILIWKRPNKVYISTDPPILVPFIVMLYSKLFNAKYIYHLQDIHPEATNVVITINPLIFNLFRWLDSVTMRNANLLITITEEMADEILNRSKTKATIKILSNPSVAFDDVKSNKKQLGFTFCGNAGRMQRIPLLIKSISKYCQNGGTLPFIFAGAGVHADAIEKLSGKYANIIYKGLINPLEAAQINADYTWALLPIEDEVTRFAFPSKSSSYVYSGAFIAAVCGDQTSVAKWIINNKLGYVVQPNVNSLVDFFFKVERQEIDYTLLDKDRSELKKSLSFDVFVKELCSHIQHFH